MRVTMISFTISGCQLGKKVALGLEDLGYKTKQFTKSAHTLDSDAVWVQESLGKWTEKAFEDSDAILFIGACGIAVRSIAPYVKDKKKDPAVIVMDERGTFAISLLSGHIGGANELTDIIAAIAGAQPVITTATDLNGRFAVDVFAKKNGCYISEMKYAKEVSAALLAKEEVGFYSEFPWRGRLPEGLVPYCEGESQPSLGIAVTTSLKAHPYEHTLYLIPRVLTMGIGCRKGTSMETILGQVRKLCGQLMIPRIAVKQVATIEIKKDEPGLVAYCHDRNFPLVCYTAEELLAVEGEFTESAFVQNTVGVGNVCERSALLASSQASNNQSNGKLIHGKYAGSGVTVALAVEEWSVNFE